SACATMCSHRCPERPRRGRVRPPPRATSPSRAGCDRALGCGGKVRRKRASTISLQAGDSVELDNQLVPGGWRSPQLSPKTLGSALFESFERHALLFHPSVIAEVENARALDVGQFEHIIIRDTQHMLPEDLARSHRVETVGIMCFEELPALAAVECRAVGGD